MTQNGITTFNKSNKRKVFGAYAAQAKNVAYGQGTVEDALDDIKDRIGANTFKPAITLTHNTNYTTLADGYFKGRIAASSTASSKYIQLAVYGQSVITIGNATGVYQEGTIFVRKGSVIKYVGDDSTTSAWFFPVA